MVLDVFHASYLIIGIKMTTDANHAQLELITMFNKNYVLNVQMTKHLISTHTLANNHLEVQQVQQQLQMVLIVLAHHLSGMEQTA